MPEQDKKSAVVPKFSSFKSKSSGSSGAEKEKGSRRSREDSQHRSHSNRGNDRSREHHDDRDQGYRRERDRAKHCDRDRESSRDKAHGRDRDQDRHRGKDRHRNHRLDRGRDQSKRRHHHAHRDLSKDRSRSKNSLDLHRSSHSLNGKSSDATSLVSSRPAKLPDISDQDFFVIDTKGDPLIHLGLDRYSIPKFGREHRKFVLGTSMRLFIHRDGPHEQFSLLHPGEYYGPPPLRSKKLAFSMARSLKPSKTSKNMEDTNDVVFMTKKRKRKDLDSSSDEEQPNFRSIEGKAKPKYFSDSESGTDSEADSVPGTQSGIKRWSIELSKRVKANPADIPAWIQLIHLQDDLMREGLAPESEVATGQAHSFTEIKLSMIYKALKASTADTDKEALLLLQMREGRKIWPVDVTRKKWINISSGDYGQRFALWMARVDFEITEMQGFHFDTVKKMFTDRLQGIMEKSWRYSPRQSLDLYREAVYIYLRLTRFLQDAGYRELAVAAWQSILELNFFRPVDIENGEHTLAAFADFWESEVLRVGEKGALGWSHYLAHDGDNVVPEPKEEDEAGVPTDIAPKEEMDIYKLWAANELRSSQKNRLPARTLDDGTGDDPFRVVMASDLEGLLVQFPLTVIPDLQEQIIDSFLIFSHMPPRFCSSTWISRAHRDMFLTPTVPALNKAISQASQKTAKDGKENGWASIQKLLPGVVPSFISSLVRSWNQESVSNAPVDFAWARNVLYQLSTTTTSTPVKGLLSLVMALDWLHDPSVRKSARHIIQSDILNSELYRLYGIFESQNQNTQLSSTVFASAMKLKQNLPSNPPINEVALSWVWTELVDNASHSPALSRLVYLLDGFDINAEVSGTRLLKSRKALADALDLASGLGDVAVFSTVARCRVLLAYLSETEPAQPQNQTQGNISAAMELLWSQFEKLQSRTEQTAAQEQLLGFGASLLYLYSSRGPYQRVFLNANLQRCLNWFPQNGFFIELYDYINSSHLLRSDFRNLSQTLLLSHANDCVGNRICVAIHELHHGTIHSAQASLERSIAVSSSASASIEVWHAYVRLCGQAAELQSKACETYYRAVSHCPWSKNLALQAFVSLGEEMDVVDLKAVFDTLVNRGLRTHVDLDEYVLQFSK
ncbi:Serine/threonine-protein kinase fray2 [Ceratocystis fimbriata CBS 114723]|uniref:Serine/threonine-protein kinase fray2 n=1 Tax=Ceratocystis fimbriata CBS 114723 TaxID=1035309 RepID=A0A2C5WYR9_9PEZI|nr:Serine/threonine-protein kinase fray2 [Ceratocystis fimbriata CBS 114723]